MIPKCTGNSTRGVTGSALKSLKQSTKSNGIQNGNKCFKSAKKVSLFVGLSGSSGVTGLSGLSGSGLGVGFSAGDTRES